MPKLSRIGVQGQIEYIVFQKLVIQQMSSIGVGFGSRSKID